MLSAAQYEQRMAEVSAWLGEAVQPDGDRVAQADAVDWLWQRRRTLPEASHQVLDRELANGPALLAWSRIGDVVHAAVAGPAHLSAIEADLREQASSRRLLLGSAFAAMALVLLSGWHFILRSMSRERRLVQLQAEFVSAVSHEFRTPLTSMAHLAEMLASERVTSPDARRASYGAIVRDTNRLRRLVEDLLDFRRLQSGSPTLRLAQLDLLQLVDSVVEELSAAMGGSDYRIEVSSAAPSPLHVVADRDALARAVWNLLDNAIKYSPDCRIVRVEITREPGRVAVSVCDQGIGIPAQEQRRIFDRFVRGAEPTARRIKGTGIGLSLVRHIVAAHGGEISLVSAPGHGSRFTIHLPDPAGADS
jgi:signal transduction histidine kinase